MHYFGEAVTVESADICDRCSTIYDTPEWTETCPLCSERTRLLAFIRKRRHILLMRRMIEDEWARTSDRIMRRVIFGHPG